MTPRPRLAIVHSRYGWYQQAYFERLTDVFDVSLVTLFDDLEDDPMPPELVAATHRISLGMPGVRVRHYGVKSLLAVFAAVWGVVGRSDVVLTSTQNPVHSKIAWVVARSRRRPLCVIVEQWQDYPAQGTLKGLYNRLSIALMRSADRCFVHGEYARAFVRRMGVRDERIRRYPHLNADLGFSEMPVRGESDPFRFLYVGRLVEVKGLTGLLQAFREACQSGMNARLTMCGDGPQRLMLESMIAELGVDAEISGRVEPAALGEIMASCDALVLPSVQLPDAYEGWGLVVGEAASVGRPLIVSDVVGSAPELVHEGVNGHVFAQGDTEALSCALKDTAADRKRAADMGRRSRQLFEQYCDPSVCIELLLEVVER